jgi:AcrR family transcriptional regulator
MVSPADRDLDVATDDDNGPRRHTGQGEERKQQLLEAAADLFSAKGYANTRIIDICERAGVAKGLFYWYFETKDSLYAELIRSMRQRLRRVQADAMDPDANAVERIRQAAVASMIYLSEHPTFFAFANDDSVTPALAQLAREGTEVYIQDAERLIREAQRTGHALEWLDPALAAMGVSATTRAFSELLRSGDGERDAHTVAAFAGDWVVRALSGM